MERQKFYETGLGRIRLLKEKGRLNEAVETIRRGLEKNPHDLFLKTRLADLYLHQGHLTEGQILAEEVLAQDPQHPQALSLLGDLYLINHSPQKALECYRQAFNRDPRPFLTLKAARSLKELGNLTEALEELEKVLVVNPGDVSFLKEKAFILHRQKRFDQALEVFEKINKISPGDSFVMKEILRLRSRGRPQEQVLKELRVVVGMESKKDDPQVHGLFAQQLKKAGQVREAAGEYRKASDLLPGNPYFLKQEGFCHYQLAEYARAVSCLSEVFRIQPGDFYVRGTLGKSFEALGDLKRWLALLEEVSQKHPDQKPLLGIIKRVRKKINLLEEPPK